MAATEETVRNLERRIREISDLDLSAVNDPEEDAEKQEEIHQDAHNTRYELSDFLQERNRVFSIFRRFRGIPEELNNRHALKMALGRKEYNHFYKQIVSAAIKSAHRRGIINYEILRKCHDMVSADWRSIPVYETEINVSSRNTQLNKRLGNPGGLYKVEIFLPGGIKLTNFVKKYAKREHFERGSKIQGYVSGLTHRLATHKDSWSITDYEPIGLATKSQYVDTENMLVVDEFLDGKTLEERLEENPEQKMPLLKDVIYKLALLWSEATKGASNTEYYPQVPRDKHGKSILQDVEFRKGFIEDFLAQGREFSGMRQGKKLKRIMKDENLRRLVELYDTEIASHLDSAEKAFTHGDAHLNNIFFTEEGMKFIDWESARWTLPQFDLYRLLRRPDLTPAEEKELVMYAFETMHYMRTERDKYAEMIGRKIKGEDAKAEAIGKEILACENETKEAKEKEGELFWQNYVRCRTHLDLDRVVEEIGTVRHGNKHKESSKALAAAAFNRALQAIENNELRERLMFAGRRLFEEDCPEIGKNVEYITRRNATMNSAGTCTMLYKEGPFLKRAMRERKVKKALKIGIPFTIATTLATIFGLKELDRQELEDLQQKESAHYAAMVEMGERPDPIIVDRHEHRTFTEDNYPLIIDPTTPREKTEENLASRLMQDATTTRARIFGEAMYHECDSDPSGFAVPCGQQNYPVQAYDSHFENVSQEMIKALLLTSEWMNSRGIYGRWGDRIWPGSSPCNSPIIFYDGKETGLTTCDQLMVTEQNILNAYSTLDKMLSDGAQLEDAIARLFLGNTRVSLYKQWTGETNYYRYSRFNTGNLPFPREARDFVGGFMQIYDKLRQQENDRR